MPSALFALLLFVLSGSPAIPGAPASATTSDASPLTDVEYDGPSWVWPVEGSRDVTEDFHAPSHDYGPGHRGIDVGASVGAVVRTPADGVVAFRGVVVDRPLITIEHGSGLVTTLEPVDSMLMPGDAVARGEQVGTVATGGHTRTGDLHLGVRWNDVYVNPLVLFETVPRAILLPCCE
ncbi:M23 family metallopeptidase [Microbacterium sp.]|uniref:murein hydrolase activator EnvC family protein n=1 Tax=Microbacterium sp. TaxID=51671 RepID=UPI00261C206C|nr:M23 family metallopeptidase [Microbacterium sp.]